MQVLTVSLFQGTGALGNSLLIKGDSPRAQAFGAINRGSSQFIDIDFSYVVYTVMHCLFIKKSILLQLL